MKKNGKLFMKHSIKGLTDMYYDDVLGMLQNGLSDEKMAYELGVDQNMIYNIKKNIYDDY